MRLLMTVSTIAAVLAGHTALADLPSEVKDTRAALEADRAIVAEPAPLFLDAGATTVLEPTKRVATATQDACVTLVVLGERTTRFSVVRGASAEPIDDLFGHLRSERDPRQETSTEGLYTRTVCDKEKMLERVAIRMRSTRGTLEVLVARSPAAPPSIDALVASRNPGPSAPPTDPGPPLVPRPYEARKKLAQLREQGLGATSFASVTMKSSDTGTGEFDLRVSAGCHSFDLISDSDSPKGRGGVDLDAELRVSASSTLLASDSGEAPDAHLEACIPEAGGVAIGFTGASPSSEVTVSDAVFPFPPWITGRWSAKVATTWASLARRRKTPTPTLPPIAETLGGQGRSISHIQVEPGRCYLAALATTAGRSRGLRLIASASSRPSMEESGPNGDGAAVVFCSEDQDIARVEVDAPSSTSSWVVSVWPL